MSTALLPELAVCFWLVMQQETYGENMFCWRQTDEPMSVRSYKIKKLKEISPIWEPDVVKLCDIAHIWREIETEKPEKNRPRPVFSS